MSTQDFLARSAFNDLEVSIELALSQTEGFRDEAENFADLARRGIRLVGVVADLNSFPANPEDGDAVFVESETQIYFWDATSSTWKNSQIIGSAIWGNVQGTLSDQTDLQTALDGKLDEENPVLWTPEYTPQIGSFGTITYNIQTGSYIRIGDFVFGFGELQTSEVVVGTASGRVDISGVPFSNTVGAPPVYYSLLIGWGKAPYSGYYSGSVGIISRSRTTSDGNDTTLDVSDFTTGVGNNNRIRFAFSIIIDN